MKAVFGLLSLVLVLAVVGVLARKGLHSSQETLTQQTLQAPAGHNQPSGTGNVREQSQQIRQQYRQQLESALNAKRPDPDAAQ